MTIDYALQEGFIDIRKFRTDLGDKYFTLKLNSNEFDAQETEMGLVVFHKASQECLLIDAEIIDRHTASNEVLSNTAPLTTDGFRSFGY
jgi:hypothetical protein